MTCTRCEGLMVADDLLDLQESYHPMRLEGHRCLSCGNVVDPLIQRHRMVQNSHLHPVAASSLEKPFLFDLIKLTA
ncbi:MAG: hypothetical protein HY348_03505 [Nitrospira defluvii]|nr:hypothetical protein [Nitrospira defluvii]